eukprot:gene32480-40086_t
MDEAALRIAGFEEGLGRSLVRQVGGGLIDQGKGVGRRAAPAGAGAQAEQHRRQKS